MLDQNSWNNFKSSFLYCPETQIDLDQSKIAVNDDYFASATFEGVFNSMGELEKGSIANPDEKRMVGHYWLRNPKLAPNSELCDEITNTLKAVKAFASDVRSGKIQGPAGSYTDVLHIGIGGSALGPQFIHDALGCDKKTRMHFVDNTDPDGIIKVLGEIPDLKRTLCVVVSKSGGTKETRNGQLLVQAAFKKAGIDYAKSFVAVTGVGSNLDKTAVAEGWLARFPMWDWVGGRTSLWSAVGLLPAALEGIDVDSLLAGAAKMDQITRNNNPKENPAYLLASAWCQASAAGKAMVVLPYKDRLMFLSRYLQQLVMESLGKEFDLSGNVVNQGLTVYGNKGSTDQHAYVQQLREGPNNFFTLFISVLADVRDSKDAELGNLDVEAGATAGDFLLGFLLGTRQALAEKGRESITLTLPRVDESSVGALLALFERSVGFYASLVNINAYHQPGVEAGKKAAGAVLQLQDKIIKTLKDAQKPLNVEELAKETAGSEEIIFAILRHLVANNRVKAVSSGNILEDSYTL